MSKKNKKHKKHIQDIIPEIVNKQGIGQMILRDKKIIESVNNVPKMDMGEFINFIKHF